MPNGDISYPQDKRKKRWREKEQRETLQRGIEDMLVYLGQAVWLLAIIAIMMLAVLLGGVALILLS